MTQLKKDLYAFDNNVDLEKYRLEFVEKNTFFYDSLDLLE